MNIGFVSTWFERGAAYVTKQYIELLKDKHEVFVYARGGLRIDQENWSQDYVTWGKKSPETLRIIWKDFEKWLRNNEIEIVLFNEQQNMDILADVKIHMPGIKIGAYIDYYRRDTIEKHKIYDFLLCNTIRHYETFSWHPQCYFIPWGTDVDLFQYNQLRDSNDRVFFFHSMGRSDRKGTLALLETFLNTDLHEKSTLIIHTQYDYLRKHGYDYNQLQKKNVQIIEKTVTAPGLYYMGDVYVYPAELDGLGLTIYEALSSGMPVIGTDTPPINEPLNEFNGRTVKVSKVVAREDGYYWPLSIVDCDDLYKQMHYYIEHADELPELRHRIRKDAVERFNWKDRSQQLCNIFETVELCHEYDDAYLENYKKKKSVGQKLDYTINYVKLNILKR